MHQATEDEKPTTDLEALRRLGAERDDLEAFMIARDGLMQGLCAVAAQLSARRAARSRPAT